MPRIHDVFLQSAFFIYPSMQAARSGESVGGTGFLVCVRLKQNEDYGQVYAVTNGHVVAACKTNVVIRLNTDNGVEYVNSAKKDWVLHPSGIFDIAVLPIDLSNSTVSQIGADLFLSREAADSLDIGPGDDTFMVGRLLGHEGRKQNITPVRFGNIAARPSEAIRVEGCDRGENFLVECRSISGYSGSPVFVWIDPNRPRPPMWLAPALPPYDPKRHGPYLLGIDAGHIEIDVPVMQPKQARKIGTVSFITAMSVVVPAWHLTELLNGPVLVEQRKNEDARITEKKKAGFVVKDSGC
jgi:trypsin-like peptidase